MNTSDVESNTTLYNDGKRIVSVYDDMNRNGDDDNDYENNDENIDEDNRVTGIDDEVMNEFVNDMNDHDDDDGDDNNNGDAQDSIVPQQVSKKFKSDVKKPKTKWVIYSSEVCCSYLWRSL